MTAASGVIKGSVLDHLAHAVPRWQDVWDRYAADLGAEWSSGGTASGFAPGQLQFGNGARLEMLMPHDPEGNDFLERFLVTNGPGPHHLTFKVPSLADALEEVRAAGFEPIGIDVSDPEWMEAFLHPKVATGVVVQLAEAPAPWRSPPPPDFPHGHRVLADGSGPVPPARLLRVGHVVADLTPARALFEGLLAGEVVTQGSRGGYEWIDLRWDAPVGVRLIGPSGPGRPEALTDWLAGRGGRVHHIELAVDEPWTVPRAVPATSPLATSGHPADSDALWEISPADNLGLGVVLVGSDEPTRPIA